MANKKQSKKSSGKQSQPARRQNATGKNSARKKPEQKISTRKNTAQNNAMKPARRQVLETFVVARKKQKNATEAGGKKPDLKTRVDQAKHNKPWLRFVILGVALALVIGVATFVVLKITHSQSEETPVAVEEEPEEAEPEREPIGPLEIPENVSEEERKLAAEYHTASYMPRIMSIPSVGIYARIQSVGLVNGIVDAPVDIRMAGWYNRSKLPGEKGATVIDGHGGNAGNGIFRPLENIKEGAEIYIEMGDEETRYLYRVIEVLWYPKGEQADNYMATALKPVASGAATLTLITCGGTWIPAEQTYTHRVFVRAVME